MPQPSFATLCDNYNRLVAQCKAADCRIACLENRITALQQGGYSNRLQLPATLRALAQAQRRCRKLLCRQQAALGALHAQIATLPDPLLRTVLTCRYTEQLPWQQVATLVGYGYRQLMRLHRRAVELLDTDCTAAE